jgi:hypothetical protein
MHDRKERVEKERSIHIVRFHHAPNQRMLLCKPRAFCDRSELRQPLISSSKKERNSSYVLLDGLQSFDPRRYTYTARMQQTVRQREKS